MRPHSSAPVVERLTDKELIIKELERHGWAISRKITVSSLYLRVLAMEKRAVLDRKSQPLSSPDAQWLFLRRWLRDRLVRTAAPREQPPFRPYEHSLQMRGALDRCREHIDRRSSCEAGFE